MAENQENNNQSKQINIELKEDVAQGLYSNLAIINHSSSEFVVDFVRVVPGVDKAEVKSRVILTPEHAKRFMQALQENIEKYESQYGKITRPDGSGSGSNSNDFGGLPLNFGGPAGQA